MCCDLCQLSLFLSGFFEDVALWNATIVYPKTPTYYLIWDAVPKQPGKPDPEIAMKYWVPPSKQIESRATTSFCTIREVGGHQTSTCAIKDREDKMLEAEKIQTASFAIKRCPQGTLDEFSFPAFWHAKNSDIFRGSFSWMKYWSLKRFSITKKSSSFYSSQRLYSKGHEPGETLPTRRSLVLCQRRRSLNLVTSSSVLPSCRNRIQLFNIQRLWTVKMEPIRLEVVVLLYAAIGRSGNVTMVWRCNQAYHQHTYPICFLNPYLQDIIQTWRKITLRNSRIYLHHHDEMQKNNIIKVSHPEWYIDWSKIKNNAKLRVARQTMISPRSKSSVIVVFTAAVLEIIDSKP